MLTLTKGGATKVRFQLGLSVQEMGEVREKEMQQVQQTLGIAGMTVLDYEDGGLSKLNPIALEKEIRGWIAHYQPVVVITYPAHGGSGHHDHIALHHAIKRLFYSQVAELSFWKRLALFTVIDTDLPMFMEGGVPRVTQTRKEDVAVTMQLTAADIDAMKAALLCYATYQEMVTKTNVVERIGDKTHFELAGEHPPQVLSSVTELL